MKNGLLRIILAMALVCGADGLLGAADYNIGENSPQIPSNTTTDGTVNLWSSDGSVHASQQGKSINLDSAGNRLVIGQDTGGNGTGFSLEMDKIETSAVSTVLDIVAANAGGPHNADVTVRLDSLVYNNGEINLKGNASGRVVLEVDDFQAPETAITVAGNSLLKVAATGPVNLANVNLQLNGGDASFAGPVNLNGGSIAAAADSRLAVGGGLAVNKQSGSPDLAYIKKVGQDATLTILADLNDDTAYGNVTLGDEDNRDYYSFGYDAGGSMDIQDGGVIRAGVMNLENGAAFRSGAAQSGTLHIEALNVNNTRLDDLTYGRAFNDEAGVDTVVEGATSVGQKAQYTVAGSGNQYKGGMKVAGLLDNAGATAINFGAGGARGVMEIDGGSVKSGADTFAITNADIRIVSGGAGDALDAAIGKLDLSTSNIIATAASAKINAFGGVEAKSYTQTAGTMAVDGTGDKLVVRERAVIGNVAASGDVVYQTGSDSTVFQGGVRLIENGRIASTGASAIIGLGGGSAFADLELAGGAVLDGTAGKLSFTDLSGGVARVKVTSLDNVIRGEVHLNGLDMVVGSGGALSGEGGSSKLVGIAGRTARVEGGGNLSAAEADITVNGFDSIVVDGTYTAGYVSSAITKMTTNTRVVFGDGAAIAMTNELAMAAQSGDTVLASTGSGTNLGGAGTWTSMFGTFSYDLNGSDVVIAGIANQVTGATDDDRLLARANLSGLWGGGHIGTDLADIVFGATVANTITNPSNGAAGDKNMGIFDAIANPSGKNIGKDTVEYVNGAHLYGVTDVAMETNRAFFSDVAGRAKVVHGQFVAARETFGSDGALASTAMNTELSNRVWAGGFGLWQDAGERGGFSGYKYNSAGVILGYDRAVGQGLVLGMSAAYTKGDYQDKGALAHDSEIESWSGGLYGIYSSCAGFFATVYGGYTYSDNDLRELRRDPASGVNAWSRADFHTGTWSLGGNAGWDFRLSKCLTITPSAGLNYIRARNGDHSSWLDGVATQGVRSARNSGLFLPVEATVQYDLPLGDNAGVRFEAGAGYAFNFERNGLDGSISYFDLVGPGGAVTSKIRGRDNARHSYKVGGGLRYSQGVFDIGMRYDYMGKSGYDAHRLMGTVGLSF